MSFGVFQGETCLGSQPFAVTLHWDYSAGLFVFLLIPVSLCLSLSPAGVNDCCCLPEQDNLLSQLEPPADSCLALSWWKTAISAEWKSAEQRPAQREELLPQQRERARTLLFPGVKQFFLPDCHAQRRERGSRSLSPREEILKRGGSFEEGLAAVLRVLGAAAGCWRMGLRRGSASSGRGPGVSAVPARCLGALVLLLLLGIRDVRAQSEFQTSSVYLWKTGKSGCCDNTAAACWVFVVSNNLFVCFVYVEGES